MYFIYKCISIEKLHEQTPKTEDYTSNLCSIYYFNVRNAFGFGIDFTPGSKS